MGRQLINLECAGSVQLSSSGQMLGPVFIARLGKIGYAYHNMSLFPGPFKQSLCEFCGRKKKWKFCIDGSRQRSLLAVAAAALEAFPSIPNTDQMAGKLTLFKFGNSGSFPPPPPAPPTSSTPCSSPKPPPPPPRTPPPALYLLF